MTEDAAVQEKDDKYPVYVPSDLADGSTFLFNGFDSIFVEIGFNIGETNELLGEKRKEPSAEHN